MKELTDKIRKKRQELEEKFEEIRSVKEKLEEEKNKLRKELADLLNKRYPHFLEDHNEIVETRFGAETGEWILETITLLIITKKSREEEGTMDYLNYQQEIIKDIEEEWDKLDEELSMMVGTRFFGEDALEEGEND